MERTLTLREDALLDQVQHWHKWTVTLYLSNHIPGAITTIRHMTYFPIVAQRIFKSGLALCANYFASIHLVCKTSKLVGPMWKRLSWTLTAGASPRFPLIKHSSLLCFLFHSHHHFETNQALRTFFFVFTKCHTSPGIKFPLKHMVRSSQPALIARA